MARGKDGTLVMNCKYFGEEKQFEVSNILGTRRIGGSRRRSLKIEVHLKNSRIFPDLFHVTSRLCFGNVMDMFEDIGGFFLTPSLHNMLKSHGPSEVLLGETCQVTA
jgi:hypothetical protein